MLDMTDFALWKQRIRLYCRGKENWVNIMKSIDEGPFRMGTFRETLADKNEGLPKDIYTLINHYTDEKDIWDNVKMLLEDGRVVVQNVQGRKNKGQGNNARGTGAAGNGRVQNRVGNVNPGQARQIKCYNCNDEEQLLFIAGGQENVVDEDVDEPPIQDLVLNVDNVFQADECDAFDSDVDEAPTAQTMFMANLSSAYPVYDEVGLSYDLDILSEVHDHDNYQDAICEHHEVHEMHDDVQPNCLVDSDAEYTSEANMIPCDQKYDAIEQKNLLIANDNLIANCLSKEVFYIATNSELTELLEYVIDTCLKDFNKRDKKQATTPFNRKKQVTFEDQCKTSNNNTQKHVEQLNIQKTNVPGIPSTRVSSCTNASGSKPRSNTKKNRISLDKNVNKKKVEEHPRTNKSSLTKASRVDSSISCKRTVVQIVLWYLDSGYLKHITRNHSRLKNFVKKFIETVRIENDHFGSIMGYEDYVIGDNMISRVYYVERLGHNLFSVGKFCDSDHEVAFRKHSCYVRDTNGVELIKGSRGSNLYTISVKDMIKSSPIYLLSKASKNKSWLWHRRLNHLNFGTINDLAKKYLVRGLPRLKFEKDHLCSACQLRNSKKHSHKPKAKNTIMEVLHTLHMDLCRPMRVQRINRKKYILVIVDDYSRFTWINENLRKLQPTADIGIFVGYAPRRKGYRIYNKRTRRIMETIHVQFDDLSEPIDYVQLEPPRVKRPISPATAVQVPVISAATPSSTTIDQDAPFPSHSPSSSELQRPISHQGVAARSTIIEDNPFVTADNDPFVNVFAQEPSSEASLIWDISSAESIHGLWYPKDTAMALTAYADADHAGCQDTRRNNMANENVPTPTLTRSDDQILPFAAWISMDILQNTNFFRAFTASTSAPTIYLQQFWDSFMFEAKTGAHRFQLDEDWFRLDANLLREALEITLVDQAHQFMPPPSGDAIMDFLNQLGYPGEIHFVSIMAVNNLYQPWRAILSMINQCLTGKTSGFDRPRYPVLQILWANHLLGRHHNIHQRFGSPLNLAEDDLSLENLKFVSKGKIDEVFRMLIPEELIMHNIRNTPYYNAYLEMVAKHERKITAEKEGGKKKTAPKADKLMKPASAKQAKPATAKQPKPKPVKEKSTKPTSLQKVDKGKVTKAQTVKSSLQLIDEPDEEQDQPEPVPEPQGADAETGTDTDKVISESDTKILNIGEEQEEDVDNKVYLEEQTVKLDEGQAGSDPDPGKIHVALAGPNPKPMHDDFVATVYPKVHESLKFSADKQVILEDPLSSSETLSFMKILDSKLAARVTALEKKFSDFEQKSQTLDTATQNLGSRVFTLELWDLPYKYNQTVNEVVKEADQNSLQLHSPQPGKRLTLEKLLPEDTDTAHLSKIKTRPDWLKPVPEEDRPETPKPDWIIPSTDLPEAENNWADALAKSYKDPEENKLLSKIRDMGIKWFCKRIGKKKIEECHRLLTDQVDLVNPEGYRLVPDMSKPLPLGGLPDFGLEELVPSLWIESKRDYNISAAYGITHWWFKRNEFYITRHSAPSNRRAVKSHMRILSVISIKTFERYGYAFLREIVIHRADYNEYKISEDDFKNLHPNDFKDMYLLHLQSKLNHLSRSNKVHFYNAINLWIRNIVIRQRVGDLKHGIKSYQTKLNLTEPIWDALNFLFKECAQVSDGTLTRVLHKLDHMVKDFRLYQYNPDMKNRIWYEDDKKKSEEFMEVIERRLKIQRIFQSLESFVGGRFRDVDYMTLNYSE
uniref:Integrase, catalytic region, zinc finger, CCHC-type, peptidase aspartic, catalytic n=1 Tax=Tanacetum cinerariifolium TaxID=118510 RepID=A0A6L2NTG1_TANCI|nr:integrase, catalytic region, zinc finger, CCHC-type, peptidase aspartic, catalytic [Tanacetum cinerariifolium]